MVIGHPRSSNHLTRYSEPPGPDTCRISSCFGRTSCQAWSPPRQCLGAVVALSRYSKQSSGFATAQAEAQAEAKPRQEGRKGGIMVGATPPSSSMPDRFRVGEVPTIYYVPDFVSAAEEASLVQEVQGAPVAKWKTLKNRRLQNWGGVVLEKGLISQPIPAWLNSITEKIAKETNIFPAPINHVLVNEYLPGQGITSHQDGPVYYPVVAILSLGAPTLMRFTPHVRLTEANKDENPDGLLEPSQKTQGGREHPVQATCSLVLMPRSLLVFKDSAYTEYLHGIDEAYEDLLDNKVVNLDAYLSHVRSRNEGIAEDSRLGEGVAEEKDILRRTGTRVSLTCRHVPKVYKNFLRL